MADKNVKFKASETSTLMEFVQLRMDNEKLDPEDLGRLNMMLICNRAHEILTMFNTSRRALGAVEWTNKPK